MEDFDLMYMMKTPFFTGKLDQVIAEAASCEVSPDDQAASTLKNLYIVRTYTALAQIQNLKTFMSTLLQEGTG